MTHIRAIEADFRAKTAIFDHFWPIFAILGPKTKGFRHVTAYHSYTPLRLQSDQMAGVNGHFGLFSTDLPHGGVPPTQFHDV